MHSSRLLRKIEISVVQWYSRGINKEYVFYMSENESRERELDELIQRQKKDDESTIIRGRERSISNLGRRVTDETYEERLNKIGFDKSNSERLLIKAEELQDVFRKVEQLGEDYEEIFLALFDNATIEELSREMSMPVRKIVSMVKEILLVLQPRYASFLSQHPNTSQLSDVKAMESLASSELNEKPTIDEMSGRVLLSELLRTMSLDRLHVYLKNQGYDISRITAYRAKKSGWFNQAYRRKGGEKVMKGEFVELTEDEINMDKDELAQKFGIDARAAQNIKKRGYIDMGAINKEYRQKMKVDSSRIKKGLLGSFGGSKRFILEETKDDSEK